MKYSGGSKSEGNGQIGGNPLIIFSIVIFIIAGYLFFNNLQWKMKKIWKCLLKKNPESSIEDSSTSSEMVEELDPSAISDEPEKQIRHQLLKIHQKHGKSDTR